MRPILYLIPFLIFSESRAQYVSPIENVIITARKIQEPEQSLPMSIVGINESELHVAGDINVSELSERANNLILDFTAPLSGASNNLSAYIRGVGQSEFFLTSDPGVGVFIDGVYVGRTVGASLDLLDFERVEILRGPQSTFFGRNTIGGAINLISAQPNRDGGAEINLKVGSFGMSSVKGVYNFGSEVLGVVGRVAAGSRLRDGYIKRTLAGDTLGSIDRDAITISLQWNQLKHVDLALRLEYSKLDEDSAAGNSRWLDDPSTYGRGALTDLYNQHVAFGSGAGEGTGMPLDSTFLATNPFRSFATGPNQSWLETTGVHITGKYENNGVHLAALAAYRTIDSKFGRDADASPLTIAETNSTLDQNQYSFELQARGEFYALDWAIGGYYFLERGKQLEQVNLADGLFEAIGVPLSLEGDISARNSSGSIFTHTQLALSSQIEVSLGLRYTKDVKKTNAQFTYVDIGVPLIGKPNGDQDFNNVSGDLTISYRPLQNILAYASYKEGYKSGGFTARYIAPTESLQSFEPEQLDTFELGFKSDWFKNRLRINLAIFASKYEDIQILIFDGLAPQTRNAAEGKISGFEVDSKVVLGESWRLSMGLGYIDAAYTALNPDGIGGLFVPLTKSSDFVNTPNWSANMGVEFSTTINNWGKVTAFVNYAYRTDISNDAINTPELIQSNLGLINTRLSLKPHRSLELALFGTNLTNETYIVSGAADKPTFGGLEAVYAAPRMWGAEVSYQF